MEMENNQDNDHNGHADDGDSGAGPEDVAAALGNLLFLSPPVIHVLVSYWLRAYTPLPALGTNNTPTSTGQEALPALIARLLVARPCELQVVGQHATLPTPRMTVPQPLYLWHMVPPGDDWSLTVPDFYLLKHPRLPPSTRAALAAAMGTMMAAPDVYWARITSGGMRGHVAADTFRFGAALGRAYHPELFVAHVYAAVVEALVHRELRPEGVAVHGARLIQALAQPLVTAPDALKGPLLTELGRRLGTCTDADAAHRDLQQLVNNLDVLAQGEYDRRRAASPLALGADAEAIFFLS